MTLVNDVISTLNPSTAGKFLAAKKAQPIAQTAMYVAIVGLASLIGMIGGWMLLFGGAFIGSGILYAIITYIGLIISVIVSGLIVAALAPSLVKKKISNEEAVTLVGYAATPALIVGILNIIPVWGLSSIFMLLGWLYSAYILYLGAGAKYGAQAALPVVVVVIVAGLVIGFIVGIITGGIIANALYGEIMGSFKSQMAAAYAAT